MSTKPFSTETDAAMRIKLEIETKKVVIIDDDGNVVGKAEKRALEKNMWLPISLVVGYAG